MKLVRDKIPQIIKEKQEHCAYATCSDKELYKRLLEKKLIEEADEFIADYSLAEAADVLTVLYYLNIQKLKDEGVKLYTPELFFKDLEAAFKSKLEERGGFEGWYILLDREDYSRD